MPVSIVQWRAQTGVYYNKYYCCIRSKNMSSKNPLYRMNIGMCFITLLCLFLIFEYEAKLPIYSFLNFFEIFFKVSINKTYIKCYLILSKLSLNFIFYLRYQKNQLTKLCYYIVVANFSACLFLYLLMYCHGDTEKNPGQKRIRSDFLKIAHWNLNSLMSHNFAKVSLLQAYNNIHDYDIICLSETFLNSAIDSDDQQLTIKGYTLIRADHPLDIKRGGVGIYHKDDMKIRNLDIPGLSESLLCEINLDNKKGYLLLIYRSPNQSDDEFETFSFNFENTLSNLAIQNSHFNIVLGF